MSGGPRGTMPPLDLRVVETELGYALKDAMNAIPECRAVGDRLRHTVDQATALLAHTRALRAALREGLEHMHPMTCASMDGYEASGKPCDCWHARVAAVLAAAQDGPMDWRSTLGQISGKVEDVEKH